MYTIANLSNSVWVHPQLSHNEFLMDVAWVGAAGSDKSQASDQ